MRANEMYKPSRESERDFCLRARVGGAMIGYDTAGTTWAVYDEAAATPSITYTEQDPVVWAFDGEKSPTGQMLEWVACPPSATETTWAFLLGDCEIHIIYSPFQKAWAVDGHRAGHEWDYEWHDTPTVPADWVEMKVRQRFLAAA